MLTVVPMLAVFRLAALFFVAGLLSVAAPERNACSIITAAEVSQIMGFTVLSGQAEAARPFAYHVQLPNETAASACFFEPAQAETKQFNLGIRITLRYAALSDPEAAFHDLLTKVADSGSLRKYPQARGFEYPVMYQTVEHGPMLSSFKAIPDGMIVLQVTVLGPSKELPYEEAFSDELKHGLALSAKILGTSKPEKGSGVPTQENVPESALDRSSLRGIRKVYLTIQADSSRTNEFTAMVEKKLQDHGIEVEYHAHEPWSYPALSFSIDTTSFRCGTVPGQVWLAQGSLAVLLPSGQKSKYHSVRAWESARFGTSGNVWGSDLNKSQQLETLADDFLKEWVKANPEP